MRVGACGRIHDDGGDYGRRAHMGPLLAHAGAAAQHLRPITRERRPLEQMDTPPTTARPQEETSSEANGAETTGDRSSEIAGISMSPAERQEREPSQRPSPVVQRDISHEGRGHSVSQSTLNLGHLATSQSLSRSPSVPDGKGSLVALSQFSLLPTQQRQQGHSVLPTAAGGVPSSAQRIREHRKQAAPRPRSLSPCSILSFSGSGRSVASSHFEREMIQLD